MRGSEMAIMHLLISNTVNAVLTERSPLSPLISFLKSDLKSIWILILVEIKLMRETKERRRKEA